MEVEVMGDLLTKTSEGEWTKPFKPKRKIIRSLEDTKMPASPLEVEVKAYEILGRSERA